MKLAIGNQMIGEGLSLEERATVASEAGYDGMELWLGTPDLNMDHTDDEIAALGEVLRSAGIECASVASTLGWGNLITSPDDEVFEGSLAIGRRQIDAAALLGTDGVLVVTGRVLPDSPFRQAWDRMVSGFRQLGEYAAGTGVSVGAETCPGLSKNLMTPGECTTFLEDVDHPAVGIYLDTANVMYSGYPADFLRELGPRTIRVHGKDKLPKEQGGRATWPGNGDLDWDEFGGACRDTDYSGWFVLEFPPPAGEKRCPQHCIDAAAAARRLPLPW